MSNVVAWEFKSKLSTISSKVMGLKKELWKNDRKSYNKIKYYLNLFKEDIKERATYYVMQDPEVSIPSAKTTTYLAIDHIDRMIYRMDSPKKPEYIELLKEAREEFKALLVFVELDEGDVSSYGSL